MRSGPRHRLTLLAAVLLTAAAAIPCAAPRPAAAADAAPAMALTRADLWAFADRRMTELDPLWRADRGPKPVSHIHFTPSRADEGWCDAPGHGAYNAPVRLPFPASHEKLQRQDRLYDIAVVLSWNMAGSGRLRNRGSAIFMHVARTGFVPTEGCIALSERDLRRLLTVMDAGTKLRIER